VKVLEEFRANVPREALFNDPANQPTFDAWQAALFGVGYEDLIQAPVDVRLCHPELFPDFHLRTNGTVFEFEATHYSRRKLGLVYRGDKTLGPPGASRPDRLPPFDYGPLTETVRRKVAKKYGAGVHLCVHLSMQGENATAEGVSQAVKDGGGEQFESVWVTGGDHLTCAIPCSNLAPCDGWHKIPIEVF
jgi:hypothetical protein